MVYSPKHHGEVGTRLAGFQLEKEREREEKEREKEMRGREGEVLFFEWKRLLSWF